MSEVIPFRSLGLKDDSGLSDDHRYHFTDKKFMIKNQKTNISQKVD